MQFIIDKDWFTNYPAIDCIIVPAELLCLSRYTLLKYIKSVICKMYLYVRFHCYVWFQVTWKTGMDYNCWNWPTWTWQEKSACIKKIEGHRVSLGVLSQKNVVHWWDKTWFIGSATWWIGHLHESLSEFLSNMSLNSKHTYAENECNNLTLTLCQSAMCEGTWLWNLMGHLKSNF